MNLSKTQSIMMAAVADNKGFRSCKPPLVAPLMGSTRYMAQRPKNSDATPRQILDVILFRRFPSTPDEFGPETGPIGRVLELSFQPYRVRPNPIPYSTEAPVLVQTAPGLRNGLEVEFDWASNLGWTPLLAS